MTDNGHKFRGFTNQLSNQGALPGTRDAHDGNDDVVLAASYHI